MQTPFRVNEGVDGSGVGEEGEDAHRAGAFGAAEREDLVDAGEESSPAGASGEVPMRIGGASVVGVREVRGDRGLRFVSPWASAMATTRARRRAWGARTPW